MEAVAATEEVEVEVVNVEDVVIDGWMDGSGWMDGWMDG